MVRGSTQHSRVLLFSGRPDRKGTVYCSAPLRQPEPPERSVGALFQFGARARLERPSDAVETFAPMRANLAG
jgi:hypothetical protein